MKRIFLLLALSLLASPLHAAPLTAWQNLPYATRTQIATSGFMVKGTADNNWYALEVDPSTGSIPVTASIAPHPVERSWVKSLDYGTTPITTAAYVQLNASTVKAIIYLSIFDSSGNPMILAVGSPGSEVDQIYVPPGGSVGGYYLAIPAGSRISYKALSTNSTSGNLIITGLN
jgi:hypothetical protein